MSMDSRSTCGDLNNSEEEFPCSNNLSSSSDREGTPENDSQPSLVSAQKPSSQTQNGLEKASSAEEQAISTIKENVSTSGALKEETIKDEKVLFEQYQKLLESNKEKLLSKREYDQLCTDKKSRKRIETLDSFLRKKLKFAKGYDKSWTLGLKPKLNDLFKGIAILFTVSIRASDILVFIDEADKIFELKIIVEASRIISIHP